MNKKWGISSKILINEAIKLWLKIEIISKSKNTFFIKWNWKKILFKSVDFWWNTSLWYKLANDKELSYMILERYNLPIPQSITLSRDKLESFDFEKIYDLQFPVIIKPNNWAHWDWVKMNISSIKELKTKLKISFEKYNKMIIQKQIIWEEIRVLVIKWEVIVALNRRPPFVIWDGEKTIKKLITIENKNELRWEWYDKPLSKILIDEELKSYIQKQWWKISSIPAQGEKIQLRWNSNIWSWGTMKNVTNLISDNIKKIAIRSSKIFWLEICWVDIMTSNYRKDLKETWWAIIELNASPWLWWDKELANINTWKILLKKLFF